MTAQDFAKMVPLLLSDLVEGLEEFTLGDVYRSPEEQHRLYNLGLSQCDGYTKISAHQKRKAIDVFIIVGGKLSNDIEDYRPWHKLWSLYGGSPMLEFDPYHFQVS